MSKETDTTRRDIHARITDRIVADLENGVRPWIKPWSARNMAGRVSRPLRHNGQAYTGLNVVLLWSESAACGFASATWMTLRQANELGAHVRRGESGATVVFASHFTKAAIGAGGAEIDRDIPFLKAYTVFNCDQIDGLPDHYYSAPNIIAKPLERIERADRFSTIPVRPSATVATRPTTLLRPITSSFPSLRNSATPRPTLPPARMRPFTGRLQPTG